MVSFCHSLFILIFFNFPYLEDKTAAADDTSSVVVSQPPVTRQKAAKAAALPPPLPQAPSLHALSFCLEGVQYVLVDSTGQPVSDF